MSNTERLNGACILLEQRLERELLLFACQHIYELVLKSVFEAKILQVTNSPDIPILKSSEIIVATLILLTCKYT